MKPDRPAAKRAAVVNVIEEAGGSITASIREIGAKAGLDFQGAERAIHNLLEHGVITREIGYPHGVTPNTYTVVPDKAADIHNTNRDRGLERQRAKLFSAVVGVAVALADALEAGDMAEVGNLETTLIENVEKLRANDERRHRETNTPTAEERRARREQRKSERRAAFDARVEARAKEIADRRAATGT